MHSTTCWLTDAIAPFALRLKEYSGSHLIVLLGHRFDIAYVDSIQWN